MNLFMHCLAQLATANYCLLSRYSRISSLLFEIIINEFKGTYFLQKNNAVLVSKIQS